MIIAEVQTGNFQFIALAADEDDAWRMLLQAWRTHSRRDYPGAAPRMMRDMLHDGTVNFTPIEVGTVLRDGEVIHPGSPRG
jgi:hypothetical protein